jgi:hypothetical protein
MKLKLRQTRELEEAPGETPGTALGKMRRETRGKTPREILALLESSPDAVIPEIAHDELP